MRSLSAWTLATALGMIGGSALAYYLLTQLPESGASWGPSRLVAVLVPAALLGLCQAFVLPRIVRGVSPRLWVLATLAGSFASFLATEALLSLLPEAGLPGSFAATLGLVTLDALLLGAAQWMVLRRLLPKAGVWLGWTLVGAVLGRFVAPLLSLALLKGARVDAPELPSLLSSALFALLLDPVYGLVLGLVTGAALVRLAARAARDGNAPVASA